MRHTVLLDTKYHDEIELLQNDTILVKMYNAIPSHVDINSIPFNVINTKYKEFGGKHDALRIGSLKDALLIIRNELT